VTASNPGGRTVAESEPTEPVELPLPRAIAQPVITGAAQTGATLTATAGTWEHADAVAVAWERCRDECTAIAGATGLEYVATSEDAGAALRVRVTATNAAGPVSAFSERTAPVAGGYGAAVRADRPTWWWRFDDPGGSTTAREEIAGAHGSYVGATTAGDAAQVGHGAWMNLGDVADLNGNRPFTVEFLLVPYGHLDWRPILTKTTGQGTPNRSGWSVYLTPGGGVQCERWRNGGADHVASRTIQTYMWSHVACVYDGSTLRVYADGIHHGSVPAARTLPDTSAVLKAGIDEAGATFNGLVDELAIWDGTALTAEQIRRHHDSR
jgi:hypothetical protein